MIKVVMRLLNDEIRKRVTKDQYNKDIKMMQLESITWNDLNEVTYQCIVIGC
jgi:hypothetical protein